MNRRFIVTGAELNHRQFGLFAEYDEQNHLSDVMCEDKNRQSILGNIYIGRVKDIAENLNAAFIEIGSGMTCYYPLEDMKSPIFTHKAGKKPLCQGDELVVQVTKEAVKTKFPMITTNLNFAGRYLILTTENRRLGVSGKLQKEKKAFFKEFFQEEEFSEFGIIVRTNAGNADPEDICAEYLGLEEEYEFLKKTSVGKTAFSCLRKGEPFYLKELKSRTLDDSDQIITDDAAVYRELQEYYQLQGKSIADVSLSVKQMQAEIKQEKEPAFQLRLYQDEAYPLSRLYPVVSGIEAALKERIWLKSGAYLVITPTEALTVIDVNSGKNTSAKSKQDMILRINKESAVEIARQLRLRNLSGICIVDFINMQSKEDMDELMHTFRIALKADTVSTQLIDITKLGLVELTRKKEKKSLYEQIYGSESIDGAKPNDR